MAYFDVCPICGATLDPHEKCECEKKEAAHQMTERQHVKYNTYIITKGTTIFKEDHYAI